MESASSPQAELLQLLRDRGILYDEPGRPVVDRRGDRAPWMFYSWNVTLTAGGAKLAAQCILEKLSGFESTQLATYGYTAVPILSACLVLGDGRYTGLCVRDQPKGHGSGRQVEGPVDTRRSVVLIDDSLSSGTSILRGIRVLEELGLRVEGAVCLTYFPDRGGRERAESLGYRIETIFDIWDDLRMPRPSYIPGWQRVGQIEWDQERLADGLHPAEVVRRTAEWYLTSGTVLKPPSRLQDSYDARGGTYVSFRDRSTNFRLARDGFWHFEPGDSGACRDIILATVKTLRTRRITTDQLQRLKIGVTFFGPLEAIKPSGLDFGRYGIVVRSRNWPIKVGGALPNTEVFTSEWEQYDLARRNAGLGDFERHDLFRHTVTKWVEPGESWLPYGAPDSAEYACMHDDTVGRALTLRATRVLRAEVAGEPVPPEPSLDALMHVPIEGVAVTLYRGGVLGCSVVGGRSLDQCLNQAVRGAVNDKRFATPRPNGSWDDVEPAVSVLYAREWLGEATPDRAAKKLRLGLDSLLVRQDDKVGIFLAAVAPHFNWTKEQLAQRLLAKAGITDGSTTWSTYRTATWLSTSRRAVPQVFGFAAPGFDTSHGWMDDELKLLGSHIAANIEPSGLPIYAQSPMQGWRWRSGTAARILHALSALHLAGRISGQSEWLHLARRGFVTALEHLEASAHGRGATLSLPGQRCGPMADCELLYGLCANDLDDLAPGAAERLADSIARLLQPDGSITPDPQGVRQAADHDFLPGAVLLALAEYLRRRPAEHHRWSFEPHVDWYLRRFRRLHGWGLAAWQMQAFAALHRVTCSEAHAQAAFELADWALEYQLDVNGAFLTNLCLTGPSFHTAFVAEGIGAAGHLARLLGEEARVSKYRRSWDAAMQFTRRLVIRSEDSACLIDPVRGLGGVRATLDTSHVRIDYVSHALMALCAGLAKP